MSDIPRARELLEEAEKAEALDQAKRLIRRALSHMVREPAVRRAPKKITFISPQTRAEIRRLARTTNLTMQQIAIRTGMRSSGRISEVLTGKR